MNDSPLIFENNKWRLNKFAMESKTFGTVSVTQMVEIINSYIKADNDCKYKISIGTDSQSRALTKVVVVVAIQRISKGGIFFYDVRRVKKISNIRQKIYYETALSLELAYLLSKSFAEQNIDQEIEIHADIGRSKKGKTFELINEIIGWIKGAGYECKIKPDSTTASCIADRLSK